jgi:uncharacterized membrane protein YphA (DoxX/SURF4 family)
MIRDWFGSLLTATADGWNRFWFTPSDPATLSVIRISTGTLLFYSHLVWALNSSSFFGETGWLNGSATNVLRGDGYGFSLLTLIDGQPAAMFAVHAMALVASLCLAIGCCSRIAALTTFVLTISFANRNPGALYGFDQILGFLTLYLSVNPGHGWLSIDAWRARRRNQQGPRLTALGPQPTVTIATRLIQLHLCLLYFVAGISKLKGATWWSGVAFWGAIGNLNYQTVDLTALVHWPVIINLLTHITLAWEISYPFVVWNRWLRPFALAMAVVVHAGIGICFGMLTFGMIMIAANVAFVSPTLIRQLAGDADERPARPESQRDRASQPAALDRGRSSKKLHPV